MSSDVGLSALIVNYESGAFAVRCVETLRREWARAHDLERLEVVVVDNASPTDQAPFLARLAELGARVLVAPSNEGYAAGMNRAFAASSGGPGDVVAILNPDLAFLPGSVDALTHHVTAHPECGAVDPRACIDPAGFMDLPRNPRPSLRHELAATLARLFPSRCRAYSARRLAASWKWLTATGPVASEMLSGCCLFLRREVVERLEGPFDARFPLYYEDADLFQRLRALGYGLVHHGGARVVHHWARSTALGDPDVAARQRRSRELYFQKVHGVLGTAWLRALDQLQEAWPAEKLDRPPHPLVDLGEIGAEPVSIPLPYACRWLGELAMSPTWLLAVGILGEGDRFTVPPGTWEWWYTLPMFLRVLDRDTGELLGAWRLRKTVPARTTPLTPEELDACAGPESARRRA